ncbi:hypothetical protein [Pseudomonas sp.]|uniref:hypothetical protein n=1 Tax=Pseudomonas sp. TaxID=306 RepID=UPI0029139270|nr:hypothetical protein [Pseudomonas sp.]MDU4254518.1 hypothetical protein [Pseudomonas sp.]
MTKERAEALLVYSTLVRNSVLLVVAIACVVAMLYVIFSPDEPLPTAKPSGGGIPVISIIPGEQAQGAVPAAENDGS